VSYLCIISCALRNTSDTKTSSSDNPLQTGFTWSVIMYSGIQYHYSPMPLNESALLAWNRRDLKYCPFESHTQGPFPLPLSHRQLEAAEDLPPLSLSCAMAIPTDCIRYFSTLVLIAYGHECVSSSVNDVDRYVIIWKLLDSISRMLPVFIRRWEMQTYIHRSSLP
jgi:hypothetical protein